MKRRIIFSRVIGVGILCLLVSACARSREDDSGEGEKERLPAAQEVSKTTEVTVENLSITEFNHEIVSNGKVKGHDHADLYFPTANEVVTAVFVRNGSHVRKGDRIASLDSYRLETEREAARTALAKAELELQDALIGQGYDPESPGEIPADVVTLAKLRSGYAEAQQALAKTDREIGNSVMTAPFDGVIANLSVKPFNRPDASKPLCTVIGNGMDVAFNILESELAVLAPGDRIEVTPFSTGTTFRGKVTEINPVIDENGLVGITASVEGGKGLYDGMNVRVRVQKSLAGQLVVPKSAVVLRSGRQVVFTVDPEGKKAMWNYVTTGLENMNHYTITDGLDHGAKVIVSGNINLAHESPVTIVNHADKLKTKN